MKNKLKAKAKMSVNTITFNAKVNAVRDKPIIDGLIALGRLPEFEDLSPTQLARKLLREAINRHRPSSPRMAAS